VFSRQSPSLETLSILGKATSQKSFLEEMTRISQLSPIKTNLKEFLQPLRVELETLYDLSCRLSSSYKKLAAESTEHFIPSALTRLPTGHETGRYLGVYFGLSYLRVAFIDLLGDQHVEGHARVRRTLEKAWPIEDHLRHDHVIDLFTWIGDCIAEVVADRLANPSEERIDQITTGISFCLPIKYSYPLRFCCVYLD
jgi:hexokinase